MAHYLLKFILNNLNFNVAILIRDFPQPQRIIFSFCFPTTALRN